MSLKRAINIRHTLAFRLTLWYATIFTVSSLGAFFIFYIVISSVIQRRTDQELLNDLAEFSSIFAIRKDDESLKSEMEIEAESDGVGKIFLRLLDPEGREVASSNLSLWETVGTGRAALHRLSQGERHVFETLSIAGRKDKVRILYGPIGPERILQLGVSLEDDHRFLGAFREIFGATMVVLMGLSTLVGWFMARRALAEVEEVTQTALDISKGAFDRRVEVKNRGDEIERLAWAFNRMLNHIQGLINGMREVTDNIAHDLKTPLTRIRGLAESELNAGKSSGGCQDLAANTVEECDYLLHLINTMLEISEAEAGLAEHAKAPIDITGVIRDADELFRPMAVNKGVSLIVRIPQSAFVPGDLRSLRRMIVNLLENAVKYTPSGGTVTLAVRDDDGRILIAVQDTGIGISEKDLPHIFERLYRCDQSRSQSGFGLGLSLALAIARAHGGDIKASSRPGQGSVFTVSLPRSPVDS